MPRNLELLKPPEESSNLAFRWDKAPRLYQESQEEIDDLRAALAMAWSDLEVTLNECLLKGIHNPGLQSELMASALSFSSQVELLQVLPPEKRGQLGSRRMKRVLLLARNWRVGWNHPEVRLYHLHRQWDFLRFLKGRFFKIL